MLLFIGFTVFSRADVLYTAKRLAHNNGQSMGDVVSYCGDGAIVLKGSSGHTMFHEGQWTNLTQHFGSGGQYRRNSKGQFLSGTEFSISGYAPRLSAPLEAVRPYGFYQHSNMRGISESGHLFGSLSGAFGSLTKDPHSYDPATKKWTRYAVGGKDPSVVFMDDQNRAVVDVNGGEAGLPLTYIFQGSNVLEIIEEFRPTGMNRAGTLVGWNGGVPYQVLRIHKNGASQFVNKVVGDAFQIPDNEKIVMGLIDLPTVTREWSVYINGKVTPLRSAVAGWEDLEVIRNPYLRGDGKIAVVAKTRSDDQAYLYELTPVPEPGSLVALGIGCLALRRRR